MTRHAFFPDLDADTAPAPARPTLRAVARKFGGRVPPAVARLAHSPEALTGFLTASGTFDKSSLTALEREVLIMTVAVRNDCHVCISLHARTLASLSASQAEIEALADGRAHPDPRLSALQDFVHAVMDTAGDVDDPTMGAFVAAGYSPRQALDVVLGIGAYTISTLANRLTRAPA